MAHRKSLITVRNLSKSFATVAGDVQVLHDVNVTIPEGSFTIIFGPSGSGKSTLLNCLIGLEPPTSGTVKYQGRDMYSMSIDDRAYFRAHTMGMVHQTNYWVNSLNVLENVALPMHCLGVRGGAARDAAMASLTRLGIERHAGKLPTVLSGGEQQRVSMARALVNNPGYIVADEPTGNLDSRNGDAIIQLLRYFNKTLLRTVVLVTHNQEYLPVADQLILLQDGRVTQAEGDNIRLFRMQLAKDIEQSAANWSGYA